MKRCRRVHTYRTSRLGSATIIVRPESLKPYPAERMEGVAVSRAVNNVKNDTE